MRRTPRRCTPRVTRFFDRILAGRIGTQVLALFGLWLVLLLVGGMAALIIAKVFRQDSLSCSESPFWWAFVLLLDADLPESTNIAERTVMVLLKITGGAMLAAALISFFVSAFTSRLNALRSGKVRYRLTNHSVIIGWDASGLTLVQTLLDRHGERDRHSVLILSECPAEQIRTEIESHLDASQMRRVLIFHGDPTAEGEIGQLGLARALEVVILGDGGPFQGPHPLVLSASQRAGVRQGDGAGVPLRGPCSRNLAR